MEDGPHDSPAEEIRQSHSPIAQIARVLAVVAMVLSIAPLALILSVISAGTDFFLAIVAGMMLPFAIASPVVVILALRIAMRPPPSRLWQQVAQGLAIVWSWLLLGIAVVCITEGEGRLVLLAVATMASISLNFLILFGDIIRQVVYPGATVDKHPHVVEPTAQKSQRDRPGDESDA